MILEEISIWVGITAFPDDSAVKNPPAMGEIWLPSLDQEDPMEEEITWRRKWLPTPVFLPEKSHGQSNLVGYGPKSCKEAATTEHVRRQEATQPDLHRAGGHHSLC